MSNEKTTCRYFTTYSGVKLPFKLVGELGEHEIRNRNIPTAIDSSVSVFLTIIEKSISYKFSSNRVLICHGYTFFRGYFDADGVLLGFQKVVYGDVELEHQYSYDDESNLRQAEITDADGDMTAVEIQQLPLSART
jgi:hypothetical protein